MTRTSLRERAQQLNGNEVLAFSLLQAAFAASCVVGPALGGLLYGVWPDEMPPWTAVHLIAAVMYIVSFICNYFCMVETIDFEVPQEWRRQKSLEVALFSESASIVYFLTMVAGHSYVFTGWEVGYPLLARATDQEGFLGEAWTSQMIGCTFLVGSLGLLLHTLLTYRKVVDCIGLSALWTASWIVSILVIVFFPRALGLMLASGYEGHSVPVILLNYVAQLTQSVFQGCNFTTLQLMLNRLIGERLDADYALPLANGWVVSLQGLARAISPMVTGSLIGQSNFFYGNWSFDVLGGIATICCLVLGCVLQRTVPADMYASEGYRSESGATSPRRGPKEVKYEELRDDSAAGTVNQQTKSSVIIGYGLTILMGATGAAVTVVTSVASKAVALPHYSENLIRCMSAAITMGITCLVSRQTLIRDRKTMISSVWLAVADWFFLWGYVLCLSYFDSTDYAATSISMTSVLSILLGAVWLSETISITKIVSIVRNVVVVILVIDPLGFFSSVADSSSESNPAGSNLIAGFAWGCVACLGTVFMRIVQRQLVHVPSQVTSFWCFAINTVLWFPPGSIPPEIRLPVLWPTTPADSIGFDKVPVIVWVCAAVSGLTGALLIAGQAIVLRYIDVGTYSTLVAPLSLVFGFLIDLFSSGEAKPMRVICGVLIAVIGVAFDAVLNARDTKSKTKGVALLTRGRNGSTIG
jgi:hypothetical protein